MKKLLWVLLVLIVIGGLLIWRVVANLDGIVAGFIEEAGTEALGTPVSVSGVELDLRGGSAAIAGLTIANPEGWSAENAFELDRISVTLDLQSLNSPVLVIDEVDIDASRVAYELRADGSNNLEDLLVNIDSSGSTDAESDTSGSDLLLKIEKLGFAGLTLDVRAESPDPEVGVEEREITLPALRMQGLGGSEGAPPEAIAGDIGEELVTVVLAGAAKEGVNRLIEREKEKLGEKLLEKLKGD